MPAETVNSSSGVLITAYGPHQFCPVIWKEKHLTGIWRSFCWDWCGKGFWKHFISIKQQREENMDYQYTQGIISWKKIQQHHKKWLWYNLQAFTQWGETELGVCKDWLCFESHPGFPVFFSISERNTAECYSF